MINFQLFNFLFNLKDFFSFRSIIYCLNLKSIINFLT